MENRRFLSYTLKYKDYSTLPVNKTNDMNQQIRKNQHPLTFSDKLHQILADPQSNSIIAWIPHGRAFKVKNVKKFESSIIPQYYSHSKYSSFLRQLLAWEFRRITQNLYLHELFLRGLPHLCSQISRLKRYEKVQQKHEIIDIPKFNAYSFANSLPPYSATPLGKIIPQQQKSHGSDSCTNSISMENDSKSFAISNCNSKEEIKTKVMCRRIELLNTSNVIAHLSKEISSSTTDPNTFKKIISHAPKTVCNDVEKKTLKFKDNKAFKNTNLALYSMIPTDLASKACETDYDVCKNISFCHNNYPQSKRKQSLLKEAILLSDAFISNPKGAEISKKELCLVKTKMKYFEQKEDNLINLISMQDYDVSTAIDDNQIRAVSSFTKPFTNSLSKEIKNNSFKVNHNSLLTTISPIPDPFSPTNDDFNFEENHNQLDPLSESFFLEPILIDDKVDIHKTYDQSY